MLGSAEVRLPFFKDNNKAAVSLFTDVGNVFASYGDFNASDLRASAGISLQSTLVLYETGMGARVGFRLDEQKADPMFRYLPAEVQKEWRGIPGLIPPVGVTLWGRHPEFTRSLVRALHAALADSGTAHRGVPGADRARQG